MVVQLNVEKPIVDRLAIDGRIIIPTNWLYEMVSLRNLTINDEITVLAQSDVFSDRIVAEMLMDMANKVDAPDYRKYLIVYYSLKDHTWTGIIRSNSIFASGQPLMSLTVAGKEIGKFPKGPYYSKQTDYREEDEYYYNKSFFAYCSSRLPIGIKSFNPKCGNAGFNEKVPVNKDNQKRSKKHGKKSFGEVVGKSTLTRDQVTGREPIGFETYSESNGIDFLR
jgi:mannose-1-phosphate guanylyltransferase